MNKEEIGGVNQSQREPVHEMSEWLSERMYSVRVNDQPVKYEVYARVSELASKSVDNWIKEGSISDNVRCE